MEENKKNTALRWKVIAGILAVALVVVSCLYVVGLTNKANQSIAAPTATEALDEKSEDALSLWTESAPLKKELTNYMTTITDEKSADF
ncbi:MAG: hypothetical protein IIZ32_06755, partial [Ruminococcus sp.]|nr:hypothetical protein [Ruminococcus sp.]